MERVFLWCLVGALCVSNFGRFLESEQDNGLSLKSEMYGMEVTARGIEMYDYSVDKTEKLSLEINPGGMTVYRHQLKKKHWRLVNRVQLKPWKVEIGTYWGGLNKVDLWSHQLDASVGDKVYTRSLVDLVREKKD